MAPFSLCNPNSELVPLPECVLALTVCTVPMSLSMLTIELIVGRNFGMEGDWYAVVEVNSPDERAVESSSKEVEGCRFKEVLSSIFVCAAPNRTRLWQLVSEYEAGLLSDNSACGLLLERGGRTLWGLESGCRW